jgi:hypothetical protein
MLQNKTNSNTKKNSFQNTTHQYVQTETIDVVFQYHKEFVKKALEFLEP